jgi:hypothetical protein
MKQVDCLYPVREGFSLVGLRPTKGYAEIAAGRLKVIRNGRRTFVRASEIERYIAALETSEAKQAA